MPIANLIAVAEGFHTSWLLLLGPTEVIAVNTDDCPISCITSGIPGTAQTHTWTDLPSDVRGGVIIQFQVETLVRRAGGAIGAQWRPLVRDSVTPAQIFGPARIASANSPPDRFFDVFALDPNLAAWTQPNVDAIEVGEIYDGGGSGVNVWFQQLHITYTGAGASQDILGCSWLPPLILAGLKGLNLFHESKEWYKIFDVMVYRKLMRQYGIRVYPAMVLREERELMLRELFTERAYAF
jgi:hypothetical protein